MFIRHCTVNDGLPVFDDTVKPIKYPNLIYPHYPEIGKGWFAVPCKTDTKMLQCSIQFINALNENKWNLVEKILKNKIDVNLQNEAGQTALILSIMKRHEQLTRFLLQQAADIDIQDDEGRSPLHLACFFDEKRLVQCLIFLGANVHKITKDGLNALHFCAVSGNISIAKKLIKRNIDFTCKSKAKETPIDIAKHFGHAAFVEFIEQKIKEQKDAMETHMAKLRAEAAAEAAVEAAKTAKTWTYQPTETIGWKPSDLYVNKKQPAASWDDPDWALDEFDVSAPPQSKVIFPDAKYEVFPKRNGPVSSDSDTDFWPTDPYKQPKRIRFIRGRGYESDESEFSDDVEFSVETVECTNCGITEDTSLVYCSSCSYVLGGRCPVCNCTVDGDTYCPQCHTSLWDEPKQRKTTTQRVNLVVGYKFDGKHCFSCDLDQVSAYKYYCEGCGYVLIDECPHCDQKGVWGLDECSACYKSLQDNHAELIQADFPKPAPKTSWTEIDLENDTPPNASLSDFIGIITCQMCGSKEKANANACSQCSFLLSENYVSPTIQKKEAIAPAKFNSFQPSSQFNHFKPCTYDTVDCFICFATNHIKYPNTDTQWCMSCGYVISNICPHCAHVLPINRDNNCPECTLSLWKTLTPPVAPEA